MKLSTGCIVYQALQLEVRPPGLLRTAPGIHHNPFSDTGVGSVQRAPDSRDHATAQRVEKVTRPTASRGGEKWGQRSELTLQDVLLPDAAEQSPWREKGAGLRECPFPECGTEPATTMGSTSS